MTSSTNAVQILTPENHHFDAWLPLWKGYQAFYKTDIPLETTRTTWSRMMNPDKPVFCALATLNGEMVGMVHWILHRSCWTTGDYCYLQDLFVAQTVRGGGVGRKLIEHVYAQAAAAACSRVWWLTHETNATAMLLYDRIAARTGLVQYRKMMG